MKFNNDQNGFAHLSILVALIVMGGVGFAGYRMLNASSADVITQPQPTISLEKNNVFAAQVSTYSPLPSDPRFVQGNSRWNMSADASDATMKSLMGGDSCMAPKNARHDFRFQYTKTPSVEKSWAISDEILASTWCASSDNGTPENHGAAFFIAKLYSGVANPGDKFYVRAQTTLAGQPKKYALTGSVLTLTVPSAAMTLTVNSDRSATVSWAWAGTGVPVYNSDQTAIPGVGCSCKLYKSSSASMFSRVEVKDAEFSNSFPSFSAVSGTTKLSAASASATPTYYAIYDSNSSIQDQKLSTVRQR